MNNLHINLKKYRVAFDYTIEYIAKRCDVPTETVRRWEEGIEVVDTSSLYLLSKLYNIKIDELLKEKKERKIEHEKVVNITILLGSFLLILSYFLYFERSQFGFGFYTGYDFIIGNAYGNGDGLLHLFTYLGLWVVLVYSILIFFKKINSMSRYLVVVMNIMLFALIAFFIEFDSRYIVKDVYLILFSFSIIILLATLFGLFFNFRNTFENSNHVSYRKVIVRFTGVLAIVISLVMVWQTINYQDLFSIIMEITIFGYGIVALIMKEPFYRKRLDVSLFLTIPAVIFILIFLSALAYYGNSFDNFVFIAALIIASPVLVVNFDYLGESILRKLTKKVE